jgi:hypothetical protein
MHNDINVLLFVIPGLTPNPVVFWIAAFAGMTGRVSINVVMYKNVFYRRPQDLIKGGIFSLCLKFILDPCIQGAEGPFAQVFCNNRIYLQGNSNFFGICLFRKGKLSLETRSLV